MDRDDRDLAALQEAIEAFAADRAPQLASEAAAEAFATARKTLSEAIAASLLAHAGRQLETRGTSPSRSAAAPPPRPEAAGPRPSATAPQERRPPPPPPPEQQPDSDLGCYVYGIAFAADAEQPEALPGVDPRHEVKLIEHDGLAALTSRVSLAEFGEETLRENLNDVGWLEAKARSHERVLDDAIARMTVVPLRLCTIYRGEADVRQMLAREREVFVDALNRLEGKAEWGVKLIAAPGALDRAVQDSAIADGEEPADKPGVAYMRGRAQERRIHEERERVAEEWAEEVHAELAADAAEALLNPLQDPELSGHDGEMLLNGVYLVAEREVDRFQSAVDQLALRFAERDARVELTGPWPPYNFVKGSIEAAR